jgi:hypothetical protein
MACCVSVPCCSQICAQVCCHGFGDYLTPTTHTGRMEACVQAHVAQVTCMLACEQRASTCCKGSMHACFENICCSPPVSAALLKGCHTGTCSMTHESSSTASINNVPCSMLPVHTSMAALHDACLTPCSLHSIYNVGDMHGLYVPLAFPFTLCSGPGTLTSKQLAPKIPV